MSEIDELLDAIRLRPGMYLGEPSLLRPWLFLEGYRAALRQHKIDDDFVGLSHTRFLLLVARRTDGKSVGSRGFHTMITPHVGGNEARALDFFWTLLDEFREQEIARKNQITQ